MKKIFFLILFSSIIFVGWFFHNEKRQMVMSVLNIDALPNSVEKIECESWGYTDVLTTCTFRIDPKEFPSLLRGWDFSKEKRKNSFSHDEAGAKVGTNFSIDEAYIVHPTSYKHGGYVQMLTNKDRTDVTVDIYIE